MHAHHHSNKVKTHKLVETVSAVVQLALQDLIDDAGVFIICHSISSAVRLGTQQRIMMADITKVTAALGLNIIHHSWSH